MDLPADTPALLWRGQLFRDVPADARIFETRVSGAIPAVGGGEQILTRYAFPAGASDRLFSGTDIPKLFGQELRFQGRMIGWGFGLSAFTEIQLAETRFVNHDVIVTGLDDAGAVNLAIPSRHVELDLYAEGSGGLVGVAQASPFGAGYPELVPLNPLSPDALQVTDRTRIRVHVRHEAGGATIGATFTAWARAAFALWPVTN